MSNEKNEKSTLDQLKELQKKDEISSLNFKEPELKTFDVSNIFEIDEAPKPQKKSFIFGKRSNRHASQVKIKSTEFESEAPEVEEITISGGLKEELNEKDNVSMGEEVLSNSEIKEQIVLDEVSSLEKEIESNDEVIDESAIYEEVQDSLKIDEEESSDEVEDESEEEYMEYEEDESQEDSEYEEEELEEDSEYEVDEEELEEDFEYEDDEDDEQINDSDETEAVFDEDKDDLFVEKKKFLLSQYQKEEAYLEQKSKEGFHFVRHVGKKFYFFQDNPANYYYSINYFANEPDADQWREWEAEGWKLVSRSPAKKKREAGWFIFRNTEKKGQYRKEIENEEEKYRFYRKYTNSCRSTMFLIFMCMAMCAVAAYLQWEFKGYLWGFVLCGLVFLIAFIIFCMYGRMLRNSKKTARMLQAKLRTKERRAAFYAQHSFDTTESEEELDTDWNKLEDESTQTSKLKRTRKKK